MDMGSNGRRGGRLVAVAALGLLAAAALAPGAVLSKDGDVIRTGSCSGASDWKLKLSPENGRIEVEFEVDQNRNGVMWNVRLKKNGTIFWEGQKTTVAPSGSFTVRRVTSNPPGDDRIVGRAVNPKTGELCRGAATFGL